MKKNFFFLFTFYKFYLFILFKGIINIIIKFILFFVNNLIKINIKVYLIFVI